MRYERDNYNRLMADRMYDWDRDEWVIDKNGHLMLRDELSDNFREIDTMTISPLFSTEEMDVK